MVVVSSIRWIAFIHVVACFVIFVYFEKSIETRASVTKNVTSVVNACCRGSVTLMRFCGTFI